MIVELLMLGTGLGFGGTVALHYGIKAKDLQKSNEWLLRDCLAIKDKALKDNEANQRLVADLRSDKAKIADELRVVTDERRSLLEVVRSLEEINGWYLQEAKQMQESIKRLNTEAVKDQAQKARLTNEHNECKSMLEETLNEVNSLRDDKAGLEVELKATMESLTQSRAQEEMYQRKVAELEEVLESARRQIEALDAEVEALRVSLNPSLATEIPESTVIHRKMKNVHEQLQRNKDILHKWRKFTSKDVQRLVQRSHSVVAEGLNAMVKSGELRRERSGKAIYYYVVGGANE